MSVHQELFFRHADDMTDHPALPHGWTIERVREIEPDVVSLAVAGRYVVRERRPGGDEREEMHPEVILSFHGLCLCLVRETDGTGYWWMGQLDESDGAIICWSPYSDDLGEAIRHL